MNWVKIFEVTVLMCITVVFIGLIIFGWFTAMNNNGLIVCGFASLISAMGGAGLANIYYIIKNKK